MSSRYQEVYWSNITSGIINDMKDEPKNKWRKVETVNLNTLKTWRLNQKTSEEKLK